MISMINLVIQSFFILVVAYANGRMIHCVTQKQSEEK